MCGDVIALIDIEGCQTPFQSAVDDSASLETKAAPVLDYIISCCMWICSFVSAESFISHVLVFQSGCFVSKGGGVYLNQSEVRFDTGVSFFVLAETFYNTSCPLLVC